MFNVVVVVCVFGLVVVELLQLMSFLIKRDLSTNIVGSGFRSDLPQSNITIPNWKIVCSPIVELQVFPIEKLRFRNSNRKRKYHLANLTVCLGSAAKPTGPFEFVCHVQRVTA